MILFSAAILGAAGFFAPARAAFLMRSATSSAAAKDDKSADVHTTKLKLRVLTNDKSPVGNASVYVRFYTNGGFMHHDKLAELDLKTNQDGTVKVPPIPQGKILIQVIATGWHTFGKWYDVEKDEESIEIKLEPPPHWY
ncbi:MAG: hypothetical protein ACRD5K_14115 [Candidatus Acidiferrales bacterium]